jgi:hypothetical protein
MGGFKAFVRMGDVVRLMTVIPVITFVKGDAKSGDTLFVPTLIKKLHGSS